MKEVATSGVQRNILSTSKASRARLRPAWLRCGPESFPEALGSRRGAESKAVITLGKVCDRRRARAILMHWAMAPATLCLAKGQGSASHPAWA